jgi:hypothetical protein
MAVPESILKKRRTQEALLAKKVAATAAAKKASGREMMEGGQEKGCGQEGKEGKNRNIYERSGKQRASWSAWRW